MTASRFDSLHRGLALVVLAGFPACRSGLPPDPPAVDPMNASAGIPAYHPPPNPYETSAFAGAPAPASSGHEGHGNMNHGAGHENMGHTMSPAPAGTSTPATGHEQMDHSAHSPTPAKPAPAGNPSPTTGHEKMNHGAPSSTPAKPAPMDHSAHTGKAAPAANQTEPRR